jgi:SAM-dependent methyltransferase
MMESSSTPIIDAQNATNEPWQLELFRKSLKKQQKFHALSKILGDTTGKECILITCGDNNGALNWHFKQLGGKWSWADAEQESIQQISNLTGDPVAKMDKSNPSLSFPDDSFDVVMTIDVHEHLINPDKLNVELARICKTGGKVVVTTPNGDEKKVATRVKKIIGMKPEDYGHVVVGYDAPQLESQLQKAGLLPYLRSSYTKFFTEMLELTINFTYVKILSKKSKAKVEKGQIAPQNIDQVKSVEKTLKMYSILYPVFSLISKLDVFDFSPRGYAVIVAAKKG